MKRTWNRALQGRKAEGNKGEKQSETRGTRHGARHGPGHSPAWPVLVTSPGPRDGDETGGGSEKTPIFVVSLNLLNLSEPDIFRR